METKTVNNSTISKVKTNYHNIKNVYTNDREFSKKKKKLLSLIENMHFILEMLFFNVLYLTVSLAITLHALTCKK